MALSKYNENKAYIYIAVKLNLNYRTVVSVVKLYLNTGSISSLNTRNICKKDFTI